MSYSTASTFTPESLVSLIQPYCDPVSHQAVLLPKMHRPTCLHDVLPTLGLADQEGRRVRLPSLVARFQTVETAVADRICSSTLLKGFFEGKFCWRVVAQMHTVKQELLQKAHITSHSGFNEEASTLPM